MGVVEPAADAAPKTERDWTKISAMVTSLTALGALIFTGLSLQSSNHQNWISEQGQITDRYARSVEELGSKSLDVRLGGIYALERLAHDSPGDKETIVSVLSAFARSDSTDAGAKLSKGAVPGYLGRKPDLEQPSPCFTCSGGQENAMTCEV